MDLKARLESDLAVIAQRSAAIRSACANEESTKQILVLPVLGALGYDYMDPFVLQPEYAADFRTEALERVDYVVLRDGSPVIAIECKKVGTNLEQHRGQLRAYFTALQTVRLGILTDGLRFEFYVDIDNANVMDDEPFLTLDMDSATRNPISGEVLSALALISHANFEPGVVAEAAESLVVAKRVRAVLMQEVREPSEDLCRLVLRRAGLRRVLRTDIQSLYTGFIRAAFEEAFVLPVLERLRAVPSEVESIDAAASAATQAIVTTERELSIYRYVCRRLAYLAEDERHFSAIERVNHRDYVGKFAIYYENIRKGRLLDFIEGANGYDTFIFPEPFGEIVTNSVADIDEPLKKVFALRVRELGTSPARTAILRSA